MKGIILAGGSGTRLKPLTSIVCKQLLPIYDKPMLYYPLSLLLLAGIREILIISTPKDLPVMRDLLGDGSALGVSFNYIEQAKPAGIAQAMILAEPFTAGEPSCLILGDNVFYGHRIGNMIAAAGARIEGATVFAYHVTDPERYGVVEFDANGQAISIEEKPKNPRSQWAVTGLYVYDGRAGRFARELTPSARGELEITDLNNVYLREGSLHVEKLGRGTAWLDTGTVDSLMAAGQFVQVIEARQGLKVACLEEIAFRRGFINKAQLEHLAHTYGNSAYAEYLQQVIKDAA
jgi:glucose-1-phosphate thymidylyltransferase